MSSIIMAAAPPGLTSVVMDIYPLNTGVAIATDLASSDSEVPGAYVSAAHAGVQTGLHRIVIRKATRILGLWYAFLTNSGGRDIAYDTDPVLNEIKGTGFNEATDSLKAISDDTDLLLDHIRALTFAPNEPISEVLSQTTFKPTSQSPGIDAGVDNSHVIIYEGGDLSKWNIIRIDDYDSSTTTYTISQAPTFTLTTADTFTLIVDQQTAVPLLDIRDKLQAIIFDPRKLITAVASQTEFTVPGSPLNNDSVIGSHALIFKSNDPSNFNIRKITDYNATTKVYTIESATSFTLAIDDSLTLVLNKAVTPEFVDLNPDQSSVTIGTVHNITNPVDINMSQLLPGLPTTNTTGFSLSKSHQLVFDGTNVNSKVQDFSDVEWKRINEQVTLAEGYGAVGSIASVSQILNLVLAIVQNPQYVNFEFRARRLDGTTEAAAFQMDDDTNPTSHNRIR